MATTTPNFGWPVPTSTDLVKDGATAIEALGDSIDASLLDLKGGTTGQVLAKASGTDMDFTWSNADPLVILDAKGDLITATAADTPARLAVGTNGQVLTADSAAATGLKWATPTPGAFTLISRTSFSAVATQDFTGVFTTTYPSYKIIIEKIYSSDSSATLEFQTRNAGGVVTGADWYGAVGKAIFNSNSYAGTEQTSAQSSLQINAGTIGSSTDNTTTTLDITDVAVSGRIRIVGNTFNLAQATTGFVGGARLATETTTGFRLFASAGNITGTVAVYGYGA